METEFQARHRSLAENFSALNVQAVAARRRSIELAAAAAREHDEARAAEYQTLAAEWANNAEALEAEANKANRAIAAHVGG